MKKLTDKPVSDCRKWYNEWVENNVSGNVLDVGKSQYWDYGFDTIDNNPELKPTIVGDICHANILDETYDAVLCNGMYEFVEYPQKMVDEVRRILKTGGKATFGFVGKGYVPYKKDWKYYDDNLDFSKWEMLGKKDFDDYHFIYAKKI